MRPSWVYILECSDHSYYTGCTTNLMRRISEHQQGIFNGYTARRRPVKLVFAQQFQAIREAIAAERQIKGWTRAKKEALIHERWDLLEELAGCKNATRWIPRER